MIAVIIDSVRVSAMNYQHVVILKEETGERYLPIWIGPAEANAIAVELQGGIVTRPLTHDLLHSVIEALGAKVDSVIITDLRSDTFYAKKETGRPIDTRTEAGRPSYKARKVTENDLRKMSAFTDFINTLDLDDFDKRRS
jgi:bifunctional DNase/RNase